MSAVRKSVTLPENLAQQVQKIAESRRLSSNRVILELIESGIEAEQRKRDEFYQLAERFRTASDPEEIKQYGEKLGRMVFGG